MYFLSYAKCDCFVHEISNFLRLSFLPCQLPFLDMMDERGGIPNFEIRTLPGAKALGGQTAASVFADSHRRVPTVLDSVTYISLQVVVQLSVYLHNENERIKTASAVFLVSTRSSGYGT